MDEKLHGPVKKMQETLLYLGLGMNYAEYMRYKKIAGDVHLIPGVWIPTTYNRKKTITRDDAEFVVSYCSETIVQIETIVGDIEVPFESEHP